MAPPGALLVAAVVVGRLLGFNLLPDFLLAALFGFLAVALAYIFSEDWRTLILTQVIRARGFVVVSRRRRSGPAGRNRTARIKGSPAKR